MYEQKSKSSPIGGFSIYWTLILPVLLSGGLYLLSFKNYQLFHLSAELFSIFVALSFALVAHHTRWVKQSGLFAVLGQGYFWIASLDLAHALTFPGLNLIRSANANMSIQFWVGARLLESLVLITAVIFYRNKNVNNKAFIFGGIFAGALSGLISFNLFPVVFTENFGLSYFKIGAEGFSILLFTLCILILQTKKLFLEPIVRKILILSLLLSIATEFMLSLYASLDESWIVFAHITRFLSYWCLLMAQHFVLKNFSEKLNISNRSLEEEIADRRHAERLLHMFAKHTPAAVAMLDNELKYLLVSDRWVQYYGLKESNLIGRSHYEVFPEVLNMPHWLEIHQRCLHGETIKSEEDRFERSDGSVEWLRWEVIPWFDRWGVQGGMILMTEVITERKKLQDKQRDLFAREKKAREKAEYISKMKDDFLALASHELRTPLSVMNGWLDVLNSGDIDAEKLPKIIEILTRNAKLELQLVDEILDMANIRRGRLDVPREIVSVNRVVEHAIQTIEFTAKQKNIQIRVNYDEHDAAVRGDERRLEQIVWNLLANAAKFTPKGGKIELEITRGDGTVHIKVIDNGIGIKKEFLPNIFTPFEQQDRSFAREFGGIGLGLSIVKSLTEFHGGSVSVTSEGIGKGATFEVTLPIAPLTEQKVKNGKDSKWENHPPLQDTTVLIVDDMPEVIAMLEHMLSKSGAHVISALSAEEAIAQVKNNRPDVLISDLSMPGKDGYDLVKELRNLPTEEGGNIPAVALSAHTTKEFKRRALNGGFQFYLTKPTQAQQVIGAIHHVLPRVRSHLGY